MKKRIRYYVSGGNLRSPNGDWWASNTHKDIGHGWSNFIVCKTQQHAIRQFKRTRHDFWSQIDIRGDGKPRVWRHWTSIRFRPGEYWNRVQREKRSQRT